MKNFFSSKLNIILTVLLTLVIAAGIVLGVMFFKSPTPVCADFTDMSESEITAWAEENKASDLVTIEYEYDETVPEGQVIYQSTKAGDKLTDTCTVYISKGTDPDTSYNIVINENTTLDSLKEDLNNYGITNYTVVYDESSELTSGIVISVDPNPASKSDIVTIKVAGKDPNASTTKEEKEDTSGKVEISETGYLGYTEDQFKSALNKLGFTNLTKDATGVYSPKRDEGVIAAYSPDGMQSTSTKITYYLSLGAYTTELATKDFVGLTSAKAETLIKSAEFSTYSYKLETTKTSTTEKANGTLYDCTVSGTTISCKLAQNGTSSTKATISEYGYLGLTEDEFKTQLTKLGFTNLVKDADGVYSSRKAGVIGAYSPDGEQPIDATIKYYLSLGEYTDALAKTDFVGKTSSEANTLIAKDKFKMLGYKLTTTKTTTTEHTNDTLYDCSVSGKTISCKLASNSSGSSSSSSSTGTSSTKATISEYGYLGYSESEFKSALNKLGFTNLTKDADGVYSSRTAGVIGAYSPDGNLPIDTTITYYLSLGPYTTALAKTDFVGKTSSEANTLIAKTKFSMLGYKLSTTKTTTSDYTNDTLYDCSVSGKTISCKLASNSSSSSGSSSSSSTAYINPSSYAGKSESEFKSALNSLGFTNLSKDSGGAYSSIAAGNVCYYTPDGTQNKSTTITYYLSLGSYNNASEFDGKTPDAANAILATKKYSISGISSTVSTTTVETSSYTAGTLYGCTYANSKVSCYLAKAPTSTSKTITLPGVSGLENQIGEIESYDKTVSKLTDIAKSYGLTNYSFTGKKDLDGSQAGTLLDVTVNDASHSRGEINTSDKVVFIISTGPANG